MDTAKWLTPYELAAWQINEHIRKDELRVELPALQRGAVWRPHQTELLWDSLLRGFPIGSLLLARYLRNHGRRPAAYQRVTDREPDFHLLDGQQRWNSITLGFLDVWRNKDEKSHAALWIDLDPRLELSDPPKELTDGRQFVLRVVTRSHPWGYSRRDPTKRLPASARRDAFLAFEEVARATGNWQDAFHPGSLPPSLAFPWDAVAPVPVPLLISAIKDTKTDNRIWENLEAALSSLPYWAALGKMPDKFEGQRNTIKNLLQNSSPHMNTIIHGIRDNLGLGEPARYHIPALIAQNRDPAGAGEEGQITREDPLLTLFVRVNMAGTRPSDDDLRFSMLKTICPDVQEIAEQLGRNLMPPANLVTMVSRLILSREAKNEPSGEPDLGRFRQLVHGQDVQCPNFMVSIRRYLGLDADGKAIKDFDGRPEGRARQLIDAAHNLLGTGTWGLPSVSISNLAAGSGSSPFFFLLLAWLDRFLEEGKLDRQITTLEDEDRRLLAGAITAFAWFAERPGDCLSKLWKRLGTHEDPGQLKKFFSAGMMRECLFSEGRRVLRPPLPPSFLQDAIHQSVTDANTFDAGEGGIWKEEWSRWRSLDLEPAVNTWFAEINLTSEQRLPGAGQGLTGHLWVMRELLHYAQRQQLKLWFPNYDPSSPDQLEDTDRPWDYDHIFPSSFGGVNSLPHLIREWVASIANLRIWPLEANRALGDDHPSAKLGRAIPQEEAQPYHLRHGSEIRFASQIDEEDWELWKSTTPNGQKPNWHNYLANPREEHAATCRSALVRVLSSRLIRLYQDWYTELRIVKLFQLVP